MTRSNRLLNRIILLVIGVLAIGAALVLVAEMSPAIARKAGIDPDVWLGVLPDVVRGDALWSLAGAMLVIIVLSICWIATRGRGRSRTASREDGVEIDTAVVTAVLRDGLSHDPDVLDVAAQAYRSFGGAVLVRVEARSRADLIALLAHVRATIAATDATIGTVVPMVVHLTSGIRAATSGTRITK